MRRLSLLCLVLALACGGPTGPEDRSLQLAAAIEVESGTDQIAPVTEVMPDSVVARVLDADGNPVEGRLVNFEVDAGDEAGRFDASALQSNGQGRVFNELRAGTRTWTDRVWNMEDSAYTVRLVASNEGRPDEVQSFTFAVEPGPVVETSFTWKRSGATPIRLPASAFDEYGNPGLIRAEVDSFFHVRSDVYGHREAMALAVDSVGRALVCFSRQDGTFIAVALAESTDGQNIAVDASRVDNEGFSTEDCG